MLHGIGLSAFRSFYSLQRLGLLSKVNLLIGRNNSGKSGLLQFIDRHLKSIYSVRGGGVFPTFSGLDKPIPRKDLQPEIAFSLALPPRGSDELRLWKNTVTEKSPNTGLPDFVDALVGAAGGWLDYQVNNRGNVSISSQQIQALVNHPGLDWNHFLNRLFPGQYDADRYPRLLMLLAACLPEPSPVVVVPALRQIRAGIKEGASSGFDGTGLIEEIDWLRRPGHARQHLKSGFEAIREFLRELTGDTDADLEVPKGEQTLEVKLDGRLLPLEAIGTGIHEAVIIAAVAAVHPNALICLEEPEIHLHPILQRKLIRHLFGRTSCQFIIATHSAHFMDFPDASIFHIYLDNERKSVVKQVNTKAGRSTVCLDLGYRPTDLVQCNCVVWVEGPSDRVYLSYWLDSFQQSVEPSSRLVEGIHYSIMFYGGRLLSHLSSEDSEINDFISLRAINRFVAILIDSDRTSRLSEISATKRRIEDELARGAVDGDHGFAWVTQGREVENYLPVNVLEEAVGKIHSSSEAKWTGTKEFAQIRVRSRKKDGSFGPSAEIDKLKVARYIVENLKPAVDILDLRDRIGRLVEFIRKASQGE